MNASPHVIKTQGGTSHVSAILWGVHTVTNQQGLFVEGFV